MASGSSPHRKHDIEHASGNEELDRELVLEDGSHGKNRGYNLFEIQS